MLAYLQIQRHGQRHENSMLLKAIVQHRFPGINAIHEEEEQQELRAAEKQRTIRSTELIKVIHRLQLHWKCAHEIFLWFCRRPQPVSLPAAARQPQDEPPSSSLTPFAPRAAIKRPPALFSPASGPTLPTRPCEPLRRPPDPQESHRRPALSALSRAAAARRIQAAWRSRLRASSRRAFVICQTSAAPGATAGRFFTARDTRTDLRARAEIPILKPVGELLAWKRDVIERIPSPPCGPAAAASGGPGPWRSARHLNDRLGTWGPVRTARPASARARVADRPSPPQWSTARPPGPAHPARQLLAGAHARNPGRPAGAAWAAAPWQVSRAFNRRRNVRPDRPVCACLSGRCVRGHCIGVG